MKTVTRLTAIPENSVIACGFGKIDYCDTYHIIRVTNDSAAKIAAEISKPPKWVEWLMIIRDLVAGIFRLKSSKAIREGQEINFPIIGQSENEIVMGENDKHLDFRVSILADRVNSFIYMITIVHFNNLLGRLYFLPVKPFHKIIVKSSLKRLLLETRPHDPVCGKSETM